MNGKQLHVTNGDSVAAVLQRSAIPGDVLPWRDPMHHGPFPANPDLDASSSLRAEYLAGGSTNTDSIRRDFQARDDRLRSASHYDEVVLWFEHDLLDQLQILQVLDWFANADIGTTELTMICIDNFPEVPDFRGLGQLNCEQLETLLPTRAAVTSSQLQLAALAWEFFRSENPKQLETLIQSDTSALPFLGKALKRHLQEYVWISDGLTRTERQILMLVSSGVTNPVQIFVKNMELETVLYIGDWTTYRIIARLTQLDTPLLFCAPGSTFRHPSVHHSTPDDFQQQTLSLTDTAREVLAGTRNASSIIKRNEWLGGVHIKSDEPMWMWNDCASRLTLVT